MISMKERGPCALPGVMEHGATSSGDDIDDVDYYYYYYYYLFVCLFVV